MTETKRTIYRVWPAFGRFGRLVPWPDWHEKDVYAQPPDDLHGHYVYAFSRVGQEAGTPRREYDPACSMKFASLTLPGEYMAKCVGVVCIDEFYTGQSGQGVVHWDGLVDVLKSVYVDGVAMANDFEREHADRILGGPRRQLATFDCSYAELT